MRQAAAQPANLQEGENITRWQLQSEFLARGLASREQAHQTGRYISANVVLGRLEKMLASAKAGE